MQIEGGCHCGNIRFRYETAALTARACQCSFCRAHGAVTSADPEGALTIAVEQPARLSRYKFGELRLADMLVCAVCGVYVGALMPTSSGLRGTVNLRAARGLELPAAQPVDYSGETADERSARREKNWTPATLRAG